MAMRGRSSRKASPIGVHPAEFGWHPFAIAILRHPSLPWFDGFDDSITIESATPLGSPSDLGRRDAMSLLGQFAAHQAFLRFSGIEDSKFDSSQWVARFERGKDCRLIRLSATTGNPLSPIDLVEQFAKHFALTGLPVLNQSWTKPEAVFHSIDRALRDDARADLSALHDAATGAISPPGAEALGRLFNGTGRYGYADVAAIDAFERAAALAEFEGRALVLGTEDASPLRRYSAIRAIESVIDGYERLDESDLADAILSFAERGRLVLAVRSFDRFDAASLSVVRLLAHSGASCSWLLPSAAEELLGIDLDPVAEASLFVASPRLASACDLTAKFRGASLAQSTAWLRSWVKGPGLPRFLDDGVVPEPSSPGGRLAIPEPRLSFLGALAIIDRIIEPSVARDFLKQAGCNIALEALAIDGVTRLAPQGFEFVDASARAQLQLAIPASSVPRLSHLAASLLAERGSAVRCAELFVQGADPDRALVALERYIAAFEGRAETLVADLRSIPLTLLGRSPQIAERLTFALIDCGRYREAEKLTPAVPPPARDLALARIERRLGNYKRALECLDRIPSEEQTIDVLLLGAELQRLQGDLHAADALLGRCLESNPKPADVCRIGYEAAMLAIDGGTKVDESWLTPRSAGDDYLAHRYDSYEAVARGDYEQAVESARAAFDCAEDFAKKIDASLDLVYTTFLSGDWERARREARLALTLIEETEGDRAAGGVLFTLAYLCADGGQWSQAEQTIERLRRFYSGTCDARRLREIDLLVGHLDFCRCRFSEAREHASAIVALNVGGAIHEAACQILDDIDWIEMNDVPLRATGNSGCVELDDRHRLNVIRRGEKHDAHLHGRFLRELSKWEWSALQGRQAVMPETESRSEEILLLRSLIAIVARRPDARHSDAARLRAASLGIPDIRLGRKPAQPSTEFRLLQILATAPYPLTTGDLGGARWRFVQRNRFGHWSEIGSLPPMQREQLDAIASDLPQDWMPCSDSSFLFFEGAGAWTDESRSAIASMFRIRSEHYRFGRALEQEEQGRSDAVPEPVEGIIGSSVVMRDLLAMVPRVARRDVPVCIQGESGTGKELIAHAIHRGSPRRAKPFVAVNCAALPENLVESELFGHSRGAFTGADRDRPGLIETSDGGTLFLDEIGEMPLTAQAKLLRFLQEGEFRRIGESTNRTADVRIVVATNRKLEQSVDEGRFREDLYYRVRGVELVMPPLRDRGTDVSLLARHFVGAEHGKHRGGPDRLSDDVELVFAAYEWPGNVRELQNTIRAAHALAGDARQIDLDHLPIRMRGIAVSPVHAGNYFEELTRFRKSLVERSLEQAKGNQNKAAKLLGMSRQALAYQIRELGILVK